MHRSDLATEEGKNVPPSYAQTFAMGSAHSSRNDREKGTSNSKRVYEPSVQRSTVDRPVQQIVEILHKWGIHTLGQLAMLDREELRVRLGREGVQLWERANGTFTRLLKFVRPPESFAESFEFEHEIETAQPLLFMLRRFLEQLTVRLSASYLVAKELSLRITFANRQSYERIFTIPQPTNDVDLLFRMLHTSLENFQSEHPIVSVSLRAQPIKPVSQQFGLFETALRNPHQLYETLARLTALLGTDRVGTPLVEETHRPDAFHMEPFAWEFTANTKRIRYPHPTLSLRERRARDVAAVRECSRFDFFHGNKGLTLTVALRCFRPPPTVRVLLDQDEPRHLRSETISGKVVAQRGPYLTSGNWWDEKSWDRKEWDLELEDGVLVRCSQEKGGWQIDAVYD